MNTDLFTIEYPHIKRFYVRAEYPQIDKSYTNYLLEQYEDSIYPDSLFGAGRAVYVKHNRELIDKSRFCIVYYQKDYSPQYGRSETKSALAYAVKKDKEIFILP